jgi:hypothetical protein
LPILLSINERSKLINSAQHVWAFKKILKTTIAGFIPAEAKAARDQDLIIHCHT